MSGLRDVGGDQTANVACQRQQRASRDPRNRQLRLRRALKIRQGTPDQASAPIRQGNGDEARATDTGEG
jgi:hypothetical protein